MARKTSLTNVGIFTRDQKRAREFYVKKLRLKVRSSMPEWGYLELGTTEKGEDASLNIWLPTREMWGEGYEEVADQVGVVTGIGFRTGDIERTVESLKRRKVKVEWNPDSEEGMAFVTDPDGNSFFIYEPERVRVKRPGLASLDFITVVSRDTRRSGEFFTKGLGMKRGREMEEGFSEYRLSPRATAIAPFKPRRDMYESASEFEDDMKHIGEFTAIMFSTNEILKLQQELFRRDVVFRKKAEKAMWGGMEAEFLDPDKNVYSLIQPASVTKAQEKVTLNPRRAS